MTIAILYFIIYLGPQCYKKNSGHFDKKRRRNSAFVVSHFHNIYVCTDMGILCLCYYCQVKFNAPKQLSFGAWFNEDLIP